MGEAMVIKIGINRHILTTNALLLFFALTIPGHQGSEIGNYARMQRDLSKYARAQRDLDNHGHAQGNIGDTENEDQILLRELGAHGEDIDKEEEEVAREGTNTLNNDLYPRSPFQLHRINPRAGMRLRRLRSDGSRNMRLRRLRRAEGSMEANGLYVAKRPNYLTTLRSAFDEIMSNSICTVAGRVVPCIREPST